MNSKKGSINDSNYFGVSLLDIGTYGSHLITHRWVGSGDAINHLVAEEAHTYYHHDHAAITVEGFASDISSPEFAISSLIVAGSVAREMDQLIGSLGPLDKPA
jgi:hypothetical protein